MCCLTLFFFFFLFFFFLFFFIIIIIIIIIFFFFFFFFFFVFLLLLFFFVQRIIFEAGYFTDNDAFFRNIGTILVNAVVGTVLNCFAIGYTMYGVAQGLGIDMRPQASPCACAWGGGCTLQW